MPGDYPSAIIFLLISACVLASAIISFMFSARYTLSAIFCSVWGHWFHSAILITPLFQMAAVSIICDNWSIYEILSLHSGITFCNFCLGECTPYMIYYFIKNFYCFLLLRHLYNLKTRCKVSGPAFACLLLSAIMPN